jgi:hypothetical protein
MTIILALLLVFYQLAVSQAQTQPRLNLVMTSSNLTVNKKFTVVVRVEEVSSVYGSELHLLFDPTMLTVVELQHGDFFSADPEQRAFVLQNEADNENGTIDYALSLLNPAPPVAGAGVLLRVVFQTKAEGQTTIDFKRGLFGTAAGEQIVATGESLKVTIGAAEGNSSPPEISPEPQPPERDTAEAEEDNGLTWGRWWLISGLVTVALLVGLWFFVIRSQR